MQSFYLSHHFIHNELEIKKCWSTARSYTIIITIVAQKLHIGLEFFLPLSGKKYLNKWTDLILGK